MTYTNVANSGVLKSSSGAALSWTHSPTTNNLLTCRSTTYSSQSSTTQVTTTGGVGTFNRDIAAGSIECAEIYSLLSPSGVTKITFGTGGPSYRECVFNEWSGNDTGSSTYVDQTASTTSSGATGNCGTINTGANAGLVLAVINVDNSNGSAPTSTNANFTADFRTGDSGSGVLSTGFSYNLTSVSSSSQSSTWSMGNTAYSGVSASYNVASGGGGGGTQYVPTMTLVGVGS